MRRPETSPDARARDAIAPERSLARTLLSLVPPAIAFAVQVALSPFFHPTVWFLFYPAVFISAWIGGLRAAGIASALSALAALWYLLPPEHSFDKPPGQYLAAGVFFASGLFFGVFHDRLQRAQQRIESARAAEKLANERQKRASEAIATLLEQAPDGIFVADLEGRYIDVNGAGARMLGMSREEIIGKTIVDLIPPERIEQLEREKEQLVDGGTLVSEWVLRRKDGTYLPVEISARILPDGRWQGFVRDISVRKELEEALRAKHADLNRAQSVANVGSWRLDVRRNELLWSDEQYHIFGVPMGTPMTYGAFLERVHPEDRAYVDREWTAALRGQPYDIEHRIVAYGETKWVREKADLHFDEHGTLVGGIGITHDITERKLSEEALQKAQERFELALRGADLAAWDWNMETGDAVFNARWAEMRGYRPDEVRAHSETWIAGIHPEDLPRVREALDAYLEGRTAEYSIEHRARTKSGDWIWILDRGKVFGRNERGEPTRMVGTELDITARKRAEEELRLAQAKASGIIMTSADAIISVDEEQRITLFNEGAERVFGYSSAEAIGAPLGMLIPERFRGLHREHLKRFATGAAVARRMGEQGSAILGLRKSGEEFPADAAISKLSVGGATILTVSIRDVTEQRRIEREQKLLAEVGAVFASTLEYDETLGTIARLLVRDLADFCIVDVVEEGEVRRERMESRDPAQAWICDLFKQLDLDRSRPHLTKEPLETRRPVLVEQLSRRDVESFAQSEPHLRALRALDPRSMIVMPLLAHGELLGTIAFISSTDSRIYRTSDLRLAEELALRAALAIENARLYRVARRAVQVRDDIVGIVAHDLRNPLGNIVMQAALLEPPEGTPERRYGRPGEVIGRAASRMDRLIQDLLDVTRMEAGRLSVEHERVRTEDIVSDGLEAQKPLAAAASIELVRDVPAVIPDVWGDRDRLLQVFENLVGNAMKFTKPGGRITIGATPGLGEVVFRVEDTGAGIAPDLVPHVFDRFWQAAHAKRAGAGLGLSIAKGIVEAHCGRIWVESELGRGTTFYFAIPTAPQPEERRNGPAPSGP